MMAALLQVSHKPYDTSTIPPLPDPDSGEVINGNKDTGMVTEHW